MHECLPRCLSAETIHRLIQTSLRLTETETHTHHFETCTDCWNRYLAGASPLPTVEVPGFLVTEEIGRGAASVVYAAWRCSMPVKLVALKVLWLTDEGQRVRFEREAAIHKRLDSPDIVKCFNIGSHGPFAYYEMEFIRGEPLDVYLSLCARTMRQKLVVFERVCRALAFAHESGVVHRDLKPSNILVDAAGRPHILDFGLGAIHSNDWSHRSRGTQTKLGDVIGTIKYMSPEQAWGGLIGGPIDHRSDIWALGVILCEIATGGVHPYSLAPTTDRCDEEALLHSIRTELPKLPPIADSELASSLKTLIERCLLWDKEYRIQSARELADDVQRCLCQCEIRTKRVPMGYRARRILTECAIHRRSLLWLSNVVATLVLLSVTLLVGNVRWRESDSTMLSNWGAKHVGAAQGFTRDDIVVVGISDDSVRLVPDRARQLGFSGLSDDVRTWRALHGSIMQELAEARPAGVVWDFYFRTPRAEDLAFVEGIESLRRHGVPVVLAVDNILEDGNPELSPTIVNGLKDVTHFGGILARDMVSRPGEFVLAVRRGEVVVPSLALATVSALAHPGRQLFVEWSERTPSLTLRYREPGKDAVLSLQHRLNLSRTFVARTPAKCVEANDELGCKSFELQRPEHWEKRVVAYERLLEGTPDELRQWFSGRIVLVGDLRSSSRFNRFDRHRVKFDREIIADVPGCFLVADAIVGLSGTDYLRSAFPMNGFTLLVAATLGLIGCAIPAVAHSSSCLRSRAPRLPVSMVAVLACAASGSLMLLTETKGLIIAGICGASLMLGVLISAQVERERQRFRVAPQRWGAGKGSTLDRSLDQLAAASAPRRTIPARESADNTTNPNRAVNFSVSDTG